MTTVTTLLILTRHEMKMNYIKCDRVSHVTFTYSGVSFPQVIVSRGVTRWGFLTYKTHTPLLRAASSRNSNQLEVEDEGTRENRDRVSY